MTRALRKPMSLSQFFEWELRQPLRHEFDGVAPIALTGGTRAHAHIQANLAVALTSRLRGQVCRFYGADLKVKTSEDHVRYPDGFVTCTAGDNSSTIVTDPGIIFEVLSPSTATEDHIVKAREYQAMPTVMRHVMIEQDRMGATVYSRSGENWMLEILAEGSDLALPEISVAFALAELYEGLTFPSREALD